MKSEDVQIHDVIPWDEFFGARDVRTSLLVPIHDPDSLASDQGDEPLAVVDADVLALQAGEEVVRVGFTPLQVHDAEVYVGASSFPSRWIAG